MPTHTEPLGEQALAFDVADAFILKTGITAHAGWIGAFTRQQVEGAIANGARIIKVKAEEDDTRAVGARGTVLGSISHPDVGLGYFVEWDKHKRCAVFVVSWKIEEIHE